MTEPNSGRLATLWLKTYMHNAIPGLKTFSRGFCLQGSTSLGGSPIISKSADFSFHRYKKEIKMEMNMKSFTREAQQHPFPGPPPCFYKRPPFSPSQRKSGFWRPQLFSTATFPKQRLSKTIGLQCPTPNDESCSPNTSGGIQVRES